MAGRFTVQLVKSHRLLCAQSRSNFWDVFRTLQEPKRTGEDDDRLKRRLIYQSKQRGWKENDLLLGTFAEKWCCFHSWASRHY
jgi:hypothetical protein